MTSILERYSGSEVVFVEIAIDLPQARLWTTSRYTTSVRKPAQNCSRGDPVKIGLLEL